MIVIGADVGGTFTDAVAWNSATGENRFAKVPSTPDNPQGAFFDAISELDYPLESVDRLVHGTTLATNTIIERRGARVALIANEGHRDALDLRRGIRPFGHIHDLLWAPAPALVRRGLRVGVGGRIDAHGQEIEPLVEEDVEAAIAFFGEHDVEAVAVALLFSYANDSHERRIEDMIRARRPDLPVSLSSRILPQWREYERTNTTVADAFVKPRMSDYLERLDAGLRERGHKGSLQIMKSNGGVMTARRAANLPIETYLSGPAGGVVAGYHIRNLSERSGLLVTDMGGTSFDVSVITPEGYTTTTESEIDLTLPISIPMLDVRTVGAGGGSIAWIDPGGALKVGPRSAGALPGPASYGRGGTEPTITDANVVLGRLPADQPLASDLKLDSDLARRAVASVAEQLGRTVEETAAGIINVCVANMVAQIRAVTSERGVDPREYALLAGGGAGPLHGALIAAELGMNTVIVPAYAGLLSASGLVQSDIRIDFVRSFPALLDETSFQQMRQIVADLKSEGSRALHEEGYTETPKIEASVELRYAGQNWEIQVPFDPEKGDDDVARTFDVEHQRLFGFALPEHGREVINLRVSAVGVNAEAEQLTPRRASSGPSVPTDALVWNQQDGQPETATVLDRNDLPNGWRGTGPAIIAGRDAITWLPPEVEAVVDDAGQLILEVPSESRLV